MRRRAPLLATEASGLGAGSRRPAARVPPRRLGIGDYRVLPSRERLMSRRWIWLVPSNIWVIFASLI